MFNAFAQPLLDAAHLKRVTFTTFFVAALLAALFAALRRAPTLAPKAMAPAVTKHFVRFHQEKTVPAPIAAAPKKIATRKAEQAVPETAAAPSEADSSSAQGNAEIAEPMAAATPPKSEKAEPINLPEQARPPVAQEQNLSPAYPSDARSKGLEGQVIFKIVISAQGQVSQIEVLKGDEPFVEAARAAVATWVYTPALLGEQPIAVYRIVKIPFRLSRVG